MPPAAKINYSVIVFDVNCDNLEEAKNTLLKIIGVLWSKESKDITKLILVNTDETKNQHDYENISVVTEKCKIYNPTVLLQKIEESSPAVGNWLEAITVALDIIEDEFDVPSVVTKQLLFITDLHTPSANTKPLQRIIDRIVNLDVYFYIVGPQIPLNVCVKSATDVRHWMENIAFSKENENFGIIKQLVKQTNNTVVCDFKIGIQLFFSFKNPHGSQPWSVPLKIFDGFEFYCTSHRAFNMADGSISFKKDSKSYVKYVKDEDKSDVNSDDVIQCVERHDKVVPILNEKMFFVETERCFSLIGFTDHQNVPEYLIRGDGSHIVIPTLDSTNALILAAAEEGQYGIVKKVYAKNNNPKFFVLIPKLNDDKNYFIMSELPYADDIKYDYNEKSCQKAPKEEVNENVVQFLDSLNVDNEKCIAKPKLMPNMIQNLFNMKLVNALLSKHITEKHVLLDNVDIDYLEHLEVADEKLFAEWPQRDVAEATVKKIADN